MDSKKRAFVTGGGGFIGDQLCQGLVKRGYAVTAFDVHYLNKDQDDSVQRIQVGAPRRRCPVAQMVEGPL